MNEQTLQILSVYQGRTLLYSLSSLWGGRHGGDLWGIPHILTRSIPSLGFHPTPAEPLEFWLHIFFPRDTRKLISCISLIIKGNWASTSCIFGYDAYLVAS